MTTTTELKLYSGTVEYRFDGGEHVKTLEHICKTTELVVKEKFKSLDELLNLLRLEKIVELKQSLHVEKVWVDAIILDSKSKDGKEMVEVLLMKDETYIELLEK